MVEPVLVVATWLDKKRSILVYTRQWDSKLCIIMTTVNDFQNKDTPSDTVLAEKHNIYYY